MGATHGTTVTQVVCVGRVLKRTVPGDGLHDPLQNRVVRDHVEEVEGEEVSPEDRAQHGHAEEHL